MASFETVSCTVQKPNGATAYTNLDIQVDSASWQESAMLMQEGPYDVFDAYIEDMDSLPNIERGDIIIDQASGQHYTVMGIPAKYQEDNHMEFRLAAYVQG